MAASYPTTVKTFTTRTNLTDKVDAAHVNDLQEEVAAIEAALLTTGITHAVTHKRSGTQQTFQNGSGTEIGVMGEVNTGLFIQFVEGSTDASAPAANRATLYARDNGAGKTQLVVRFATGAVQVIATEP
jgi:hypothetical protein